MSILALVFTLLLSTISLVQEPGWTGPVFARGELREQIESTPIEYRSYRPFHFYGNTIRRRYYRGRVAPTPRDFYNGTRTLLRRNR